MIRRILVWMTIPVFTVFYSCSKDDTETSQSSKTLPTQIVVDIPTSISSSGSLKSLVQNTDTSKGGLIYSNLRLFIGVGEVSADVVQGIFNALKQHNINKAMEFDFVSNDDQKTKHCVVVENASYEGVSYEMKLTISDGPNKALQVFWSGNPVKGVAILNPHWINRNDTMVSAMYKIEFGRKVSSTYDSEMTVSITGLPAIGLYGINNLKMFVGKKGNTVEVIGNSNHPHAVLFDVANTDGLSYAFAARADSVSNIAVAKLALPGTSLATNAQIFDNYSVYKVFSTELHKIWDPIATTPQQQAVVNALIDYNLQHAQIPAYFNNSGYIGCGATLPTGFTSSFTDLGSLLPYAPVSVKNMTISFAE